MASPIRTCAASRWKCPTPLSAPKRWACGCALWAAQAGNGFRRIAVRGPNQTPFLAGEQNASYLGAEPADDARFIPVFAHALEHTAGYTPEEATRVAASLLPDVLH